jgi:hypothetical protein
VCEPSTTNVLGAAMADVTAKDAKAKAAAMRLSFVIEMLLV